METYKLYEGKLELKYLDSKHLYTVEEKPVESITGILKVISKPALIPWAVKETGDYLSRHLKPGTMLDEVSILRLISEAKKAHRITSGHAADIGTWAHEWFAKYFSGEKPPQPINPLLLQIVQGLKSFLGGRQVKVNSSERKLYSVEHRVAGTLDLDCYIDGKRTLVDFKTSSGIYPDMFVQLGGYDLLASEEDEFVALGKGEKYDPFVQHMIVNFKKQKEGVPDSETLFDPARDIKISKDVLNNKLGFLGALQLYRSLDGIKAETGLR